MNMIGGIPTSDGAFSATMSGWSLGLYTLAFFLGLVQGVIRDETGLFAKGRVIPGLVIIFLLLRVYFLNSAYADAKSVMIQASATNNFGISGDLVSEFPYAGQHYLEAFAIIAAITGLASCAGHAVCRNYKPRR